MSSWWIWGGASRFFPASQIDLERNTPNVQAYKDERTKSLYVIPLAIDPASVWRVENWDEIFNNLAETVRKNIVKYSIDAVFLDMYQLSRITAVEVFGLDKSDMVVLVVEGYEDCTKPLALVKKFFDAKVVTVLNKHERGVEYPGAALKISFSAALDYYNRWGQLYTKHVAKLAEYLLQVLKRVSRSRWFE